MTCSRISAIPMQEKVHRTFATPLPAVIFAECEPVSQSCSTSGRVGYSSALP